MTSSACIQTNYREGVLFTIYMYIYIYLVWYMPRPSRMGVASRTCCSIQECCPLMAARNWRISLVLSVFPAPDSPLSQQIISHVMRIPIKTYAAIICMMTYVTTMQIETYFVIIRIKTYVVRIYIRHMSG